MYKYVFILHNVDIINIYLNIELCINSKSLMESIDIKILNIMHLIPIINKDIKFIKFIKEIFKKTKPYMILDINLCFKIKFDKRYI